MSNGHPDHVCSLVSNLQSIFGCQDSLFCDLFNDMEEELALIFVFHECQSYISAIPRLVKSFTTRSSRTTRAAVW